MVRWEVVERWGDWREGAMGRRTFSYILQVNSTRSERAEELSYPIISLISWFSLVFICFAKSSYDLQFCGIAKA